MIESKTGLRPLEPNWAQDEFLDEVERQRNDGKPVRIIILKARQLGMSTITEAVLFWDAFLHDHRHSMVIAHETDSSEHLLGMTKTYWEHFPYKALYTPKYLSRKELEWKETNSTIRVATAKNVRTGRGRTLQALHASEAAFWDRPAELMLGLRQTIPQVPGTLIIVESTGNGVGDWFYETWQEAEIGENDYTPLFFPWWRHPEYCGSFIGVTRPLGHLTEEERILKAIGVDDDHLVWRRWAIKNLAGNDDSTFMQEYPATPEEAFISTGTNVFPISALRQCYEPMEGARGFMIRDGERVKFATDRSGPMTMYRTPSADSDWGQYFVAGDPTHTTMGDYACVQVINRRTYEQVATWRGKIDPMSFAEELAKIGRYYNNAVISTEVEGPGYATVGRLMELDYPNIWRHRWADKTPGKLAETYGWSTTFKRKEWAIGWLIKLLVDQDLTLHDKTTFNEMATYVTLPQGGYGPADWRDHDDTVMAMAIACICSSTEGPLAAYEGRKEAPEPVPVWEEWGVGG